MNSNSSVYYFLIANMHTQKEIGTFVDNSVNGNTISDFNNIVGKSKEILHSKEILQSFNRRNRMILENHNIYYIVTNTYTFYLAAVRKDSKYCENENLVFELIEDIEHQGIKKLVDKNGELTNVGRQNLKFSIEKYQETNRSRLGSTGSTTIFDTISLTERSDPEPISKISSLNSQIGEIKNEMKQNVQNMISNVGEMQDLDSKSARIKDTSLEFRNNSIDLEKKAKWNQYKMKIIIVTTILIVGCFILFLIFKK